MKNPLQLALSGLALFGSFVVASGAQAEHVNFSPAENNFCPNLISTANVEAYNQTYDRAFNQYIEICAGSQWQKRFDTYGGTFGHAFALIRGACRVQDPISGIPQLKPCPGNVVGISTDAQYHSVVWTAVEGRDFMLYAGIAPQQPFDLATAARVREAAKTEGFLTGMSFKDYNNKENRERLNTEEEKRASDLEWAVDFTLATDYGIALSRGASCTRIPLNGTKPGKEDGPLIEVINYLNQLNQNAYRASLQKEEGKPFGFEYDPVVNNCTHPLHNTLAALGVWRPKNTTGHPTSTLQQLARSKDLAAPFNTMLDAYEANSEIDLDFMIKWLKRNSLALKMLQDYGWVGPQAGVIIEEIQPHNFRNEVFDPNVNRGFFSLPGQMLSAIHKKVSSWIPEYDPLARRYTALTKDPANIAATDLVSNLRMWNEKYRNILEDARLNGTDPVVVELRNYFQAKYRETNDRLLHVTRFQPGTRFANLTPMCLQQPPSL